MTEPQRRGLHSPLPGITPGLPKSSHHYSPITCRRTLGVSVPHVGCPMTLFLGSCFLPPLTLDSGPPSAAPHAWHLLLHSPGPLPISSPNLRWHYLPTSLTKHLQGSSRYNRGERRQTRLGHLPAHAHRPPFHLSFNQPGGEQAIC